jgi:phytoene dehydrogenase-like protein
MGWNGFSRRFRSRIRWRMGVRFCCIARCAQRRRVLARTEILIANLSGLWPVRGKISRTIYWGQFPKNPLAVAKFGVHALRSAKALARSKFSGERARALFAGLSAHSMLPLEKTATAAFGLVLAGAGHAVGWPFPKGGAQKISDALAAYLRSLGGEIITGLRVDSLEQLHPCFARERPALAAPLRRSAERGAPAAETGRPVILCDMTPRQLLRIAGSRFPDSYRRKLERYRYGPGAFKVDWALSGPIPWRARECALAGTVHVGGTLDEVAASERAAWKGDHAERPFVILAQPTLFDPSRAPEGKHIAWAYCHVPNGSTFDMLERIERQIERFAPGFREVILARSVMNTTALETHNPNLVGGDINGGAQNIGQLFMRPTASIYSTPDRGVYICSASTPPGGGVHGMCGYFAAQKVLRGALKGLPQRLKPH